VTLTARLNVVTDVPSGRSTRGSHQLSAALTCERYWWLKYAQMYLPVRDKPFRLRGTLIHLCMQYHYGSKMAQAPSWFYEQTLDAALEERGRGFPSDILLAKGLLEQYRTTYVQEPWTPFVIEEEFSASIGELDPGGPDPSLDSEVITCRPDLLVMATHEVTRTPVLDMFDYKTAGKNWEFADGKWRIRGGLEPWKDDGGPYRIFWQALVYLHILRTARNAARLENMQVRGFWIQRMTREPDRFQRHHFDRHLLTIPPVAYDQTPRLIRAAVAKERYIRENAEKGIKPLPCFHACRGPFGLCDFIDVCAARTPEDQLQVLARDYYRDA